MAQLYKYHRKLYEYHRNGFKVMVQLYKYHRNGSWEEAANFAPSAGSWSRRQ